MKKKLFSILISLMFVFSAVFQSYLPIYSVHAEDENVEINEDNFPDDIFRNYILETIDTDKNGSLSVSEIENAKSIRIDDESLTDLTGIEYFVFLESLDCSVTKVLKDDFTINVTNNIRLKKLNVSGRKIGNIDVSHNLELESFACRGCSLSTLDVSKNTKLTSLDINNNRRISSLDVSHNNLLASLFITSTFIESINLENLKELERLDVYETKINGLDVSQSEKLEYLGFSPSMNIAWLNVGNNNDLLINWLTSPSNFTISGCGASFKIQDEFPGIDVSKVKIISGGNIDNNTGVVYGYKVGSSTIIYEYDCGIVNDSPKKHEVKLSVRSSTSNKGESTVIFKDKLDKVYDGKAVETPKDLTIVGSQAEPTYKWYQKDGEGWKELAEAPTQAGDYRIVVSVAGDANYNGCEVSQEFKITKAESSATMNDKLDKVYDGKAVETPKDLTIVGSEAEPTYKWYQKDGEGWKELEEAPTQAGDYRIVVSVAGDANYNDCEVSQEFKITKAESSATIKDKLDKVYDGKAVETPKDLTIVGSQAEPTYKWYQKDGEGWKELEEAPTQAGDYRIVVSVAGDANYNGCEVSQEFKITKAESSATMNDKLDKVYDGKAVEVPKDLEIVGSEAEPTYKWYQKDGDGWKELEEAPTQAGDYRIVVSVAGDANYNDCEVSQEFKITKAESSATIKDKLDKVYDGKAVETPKYLTIVGSQAEPTYKWYQKDGEGWKELEEAPSQAGDYRIVVSVAGDTNYNGCEVSQEFKITKAESSATIKDKLDKVYDGKAVETPKDLTIVGSQAEPTYKWYQKDGEDWKELEEAPTQAGDYRIVVSVAGDANYNGCEVSQEFKITKAIPTYEIPNLSDGYINGSLKDIILPDCWMWVNENQSFDKIGIQTFNAIYIPSDIINYEIIYNIPLKVNVLEKEESLSENKPSIDVDIAENIDRESENNVDKNDNTTHIVKTNDNTLVIGWIVGIIVSVSLMSIIIKHKKN